jgi:G3E family GTPase
LKAELHSRWWAAVPTHGKAKNPDYYDMQDAIAEKYDKQLGDRMNEIVFIGQDMDEEHIIKELQECLISLQEKVNIKA